MLALSFLLLIGFTLIVEGFHLHIPKGYIYFAMGFSVLVETLNLRLRRVPEAPVNLREAYTRGAKTTSPQMVSVPNMPAKITPKRKSGKKRR
jgi:hypothetical protein